MNRIHFGIFFVLTTALLAWAVPQQINHQGFLTRTSGAPLDTTFAMTFMLYTDSLSGSLLWTENRPLVTVTAGLFNVKLGQSLVLPDSVFNPSQVWLGIRVGGDAEMTPCSRIVSVGYSYRVGTVDGASGGVIDGDVMVSGKAAIGAGDVNPGAYAFVTGQNDSASGDFSTVSGGHSNLASQRDATVGGGNANQATATQSTISYLRDATISGGHLYTANGSFSTIGGGQVNLTMGNNSFIGGGSLNRAGGGDYSVVAGGTHNTITGSGSCIPGGRNNSCASTGSFACGTRFETAQASH